MAKQGVTFSNDVFPCEQQHVRDRRAALGLDPEPVKGPPDPSQELVGLGLSGGGIRSATFGLGVIQGLARNGLLRHVDFLSTVSGGGYIGSCLSCLMNDPKHRPEGDRFPLRYTTDSAEPPAMSQLRNFSNYLSPVGLLPMLRLPNLMLRGILLNLFVFLPFIMVAVFFTELAYEHGPHWDNLPRLIGPLVLIFLILTLAFPFLMRLMRSLFNWRRRNSYELLLTVPLLLAGIVLVAIPFLHITRLAIEHDMSQVIAWFKFLPPADVWKFGLGVLALATLFALAGKASENAARLKGKLVLWLIGLTGPAVLFVIFILLCLWQIDSPFLPAGADRGLNAATECPRPCLAVDQDKSRKLNLSDSDDSLWSLLFHQESGATNPTELAHALQGRGLTLSAQATVRCLNEAGCKQAPADWRQDPRVWVINNQPQNIGQCPGFEQTELRAASPARESCTYISRISQNSLRIDGPQLKLFEGKEDYWFVGIFLALLLINRFLLDINITSPHGFYRDRLSKAFLFSVDDDGAISQQDNLKLSALNQPGSTAPYHLVNVAMNLQGSDDPSLRGRECDFFTFSRDFCGGERTGWSPTTDMERFDQHLDLATAMAISGAAAAPNMGTTTNRALVFIMTLLNIRLGYWLPNPEAVNRKMWFKRMRLASAKPTLIWKEALGRLTGDGTHINISDGGHIENLALYQLLRRQCKFIVAVDGECDPDMQFGGLATLMRYARIDLGTDIDINLDELRKQPDGLSKNHWSLGNIRYPDGGTGQLLYVKLSVTGDEPEYVRAYRAHHPEFPHESTADQFFTEAQFEAYRALGAHACEGMLADVAGIGGFAALKARAEAISAAI